MNEQDKQAMAEEARQLDMAVSELVRCGASGRASKDELVALAEAARASASRSIAAMDETARMLAGSNARIAAMEAKAKADREPKAAAGQGHDQQREAFRQANAIVSLEGWQPSPGALAIQERVVRGELTHDEAVAAHIVQASSDD